MIAYVESNFVLELALLQEEHRSALSILELAESGQVGLRMPAYCGGEPYERMVRRAKDRKALRESLAQEIRELSRCQPYTHVDNISHGLTSILTKSADEEKARLDTALARIIKATDVIALDGPILGDAIGLQASLGLSPQDSIVLASISANLSSTPADEKKIFVTRNSKDFLTPDIVNMLGHYNCKLLTRFFDSLGYIQSLINPASNLSNAP